MARNMSANHAHDSNGVKLTPSLIHRKPVLRQRTISVMSYDCGISMVTQCSTNDDVIKSDDLVTEKQLNVPDGGWGWVIVGAAFSNLMLISFVFTVFIVYYVSLEEYFDSDKGITGGILSLYSLSGHILGIVFGSLVERYGSRTICLIGNISMVISLILTSFLLSIPYLYAVFGIIGGISSGSILLSSVVILQQYFDKRRALAVGIGLSGFSFGEIIAPSLATALLDEYGLSGAYLITAGIVSHTLIASALYRPIKTSKQKQKTANDEDEAILSLTNDSSSKLHNDLSTPPQLLHSMQDVNQIISRLDLNSISSSKQQSSLDIVMPNGLHPNIQVLEIHASAELTKIDDEAHMSQSHIEQDVGIISNILTSIVDSICNDESDYENLQIQDKESFPFLEMQGKQLGSDDSCLKSKLSSARKCQKYCKSLFDVTLLRNVTFSLFLLGTFCIYMGVLSYMTHFLNRCFHYDIDRSVAIILQTILAISIICGRYTFTAITFANCMDILLLYGLNSAVSSVFVITLPFATTVVPLAINAVGLGLCVGGIFTIPLLAMTDVAGIDRVAKATGFLNMSIGLGIFVAVPLTGYIYDVTLSYDIPFYVAGVIHMLGAIIILMSALLTNRKVVMCKVCDDDGIS